jgi:hypothetical protein
MANTHTSTDPLPLSQVVRTWWPLAASWLLMSAEQPAFQSIVSRLADGKINIAAWGQIVFPLALVIESPIIMLLAASTALSKDCASYRWLRRFMMWSSGILTVLHILVAFTPLFDLVVIPLFSPKPELVEPARLGLMLMTPWTWSIAYRRFNQGVLIRFGHSRAVGVGTLIRLGSEAVVLAVGYSIGTLPGMVVGASAITVGVMSEALYAGLRVRPVLRDQVSLIEAAEPPLSFIDFLRFYVPLSLTSLLYLLMQPMGGMALGRMPQEVDSAAAWSVSLGLLFTLRSVGIACNEVVVTLLDEPEAAESLRRFAVYLTITVTVLTVLLVATPLSLLWLQYVVTVDLTVTALVRQALWLALLVPGLTAMQNWYQGVIVHSRRTRAISEAMFIFLLTTGAVLLAGVLWGQVAGVYVGMVAFTGGTLLQTLWLWYRSRPIRRELQSQRP